MNEQPSFFDGLRTNLGEAIEQTKASLLAYAGTHQHWAIAYSGGKDSSATVTVVAHLIETGQIPAPKSLTVMYADTRMEITPLQVAAMKVMDELRARDIDCRVVLPEMDERFMVYMLGRGVPPPKNRFRWCTSQIKIEPMMAALRSLREECGEKLLMITGVRLGESVARDARIVMSCSRDGAECGQGWFQEATPEAVADTLAPLLHWRVCHVWAWLTAHCPDLGFPTLDIAIAYGGKDAEEVNARTGCVGCPLASKDNALLAVVRRPEWAYLSPLLRLKPLYNDLSFNHANRLRKVDVELRKDGTAGLNPQRVGPLTLEARLHGLDTVLGIQREINEAAGAGGRPTVSLIDAEEEARIRELIAANTWPRGWDGTEAEGDALVDRINRDGSVQPLLAQLGEVIWSKPNPMPESVTDRCTKAHEYLFLLTKSPRYYYDAEAIRTPWSPETKQQSFDTMDYGLRDRYAAAPSHKGSTFERGKTAAVRPTEGAGAVGTGPRMDHAGGANKRSVWEIATEAYPEAHFATFPTRLVEPCILAGTSELGCCAVCGAPWVRQVEKVATGRTQKMTDGWAVGNFAHGTILADDQRKGEAGKPVMGVRTVGWMLSCGHESEPVPATVLDPFSGAGTTGLVALRLGRAYLGIELNPEYVAMSDRRLREDAPLLRTGETTADPTTLLRPDSHEQGLLEMVS